MLNHYPRHTLGQANEGWLESRFHFSFAGYQNAERMQFGKLRVINDDTIAPGTGFPMHGHRDMEIITFVREGAITHEDSRGNKGRTEAGDVQVMSAGTGIFHSEYNLENEPTRLFQIWIIPGELGVEPRWETTRFAQREAADSLPVLVSGRAEDRDTGALFIHQDAAIFGGRMKQGKQLSQALRHKGYLLVSAGEVHVEGQPLLAGDGLEITDQEVVTIDAVHESEVILIDVPA